MSFQRTGLSADRTLMSVIRTSLSLISFGFTIFQLFLKLSQAKVVGSGTGTVRNFGAALVLSGVVMLVLGIGYHLAFMKGLREERRRMIEEGLIHGESPYPVSMTLIVAVLLLVIGLFAIANIAFNLEFELFG
jgi:putative membrane protein